MAPACTLQAFRAKGLPIFWTEWAKTPPMGGVRRSAAPLTRAEQL